MIVEAVLLWIVLILLIYGGMDFNGYVLQQYERSCFAKATDIALHGGAKPNQVACGAHFLGIYTLGVTCVIGALMPNPGAV